MIEGKEEESLYLSGKVVLEMLEAVQGKGADFRFRARGISMAPTIRNGDILTLSQPADIPPGKGEVAAFFQPKTARMLVHRIRSIQGKHYIIKGDNIYSQPIKVQAENIAGVVTAVERGGKHRFWPHRNHNPKLAGIYFRYYLLKLKLIGIIKKAVRTLLQ